MQYWKAHYKDERHDTDITIINTEEDYSADPLSFTLDGIAFRGASISAFQLADGTQYEEAKEKFCLLKWGGHNEQFHIDMPYAYDLQQYALTVEIPVSVYRKRDGVPNEQSLYWLVFCDNELSYEGHKEEFSIGIFSSLEKARETAKYYADCVDGFKDYDCSYRIVEKKVIDGKAAGEVYIVFGWNENQELDETDVIESECFIQEEAAERRRIGLQKKYSRSNWCIDRFVIDACLWKEGFVRV